jgi:hypothetical protein
MLGSRNDDRLRHGVELYHHCAGEHD